MVIGCVFVLALIWFDVFGVGAMLAKDASGIATLILFFQTSLTFGFRLSSWSKVYCK